MLNEPKKSPLIAQGAFSFRDADAYLSAALVMALPALDMSLPMPATVLQPARTKPNTTKAVSTILLRMLALL